MSRMINNKEDWNRWAWGDYQTYGTSLRQLEKTIEKAAQKHDALFEKGCIHGAKLVTEVLKKGEFTLDGCDNKTSLHVSYDTDGFGYMGNINLVEWVDIWEPEDRVRFVALLRRVADKIETTHYE